MPKGVWKVGKIWTLSRSFVYCLLHSIVEAAQLQAHRSTHTKLDYPVKANQNTGNVRYKQRLSQLPVVFSSSTSLMVLRNRKLPRWNRGKVIISPNYTQLWTATEHRFRRCGWQNLYLEFTRENSAQEREHPTAGYRDNNRGYRLLSRKNNNDPCYEYWIWQSENVLGEFSRYHLPLEMERTLTEGNHLWKALKWKLKKWQIRA